MPRRDHDFYLMQSQAVIPSSATLPGNALAGRYHTSKQLRLCRTEDAITGGQPQRDGFTEQTGGEPE